MKYDTMSIERKDAEILVNTFKREFKPSFEYTSKSGNVKIRVLEKYNLRINSTLAATLLFGFEGKDLYTINIVVCGGKVGFATVERFNTK